MIERDKPKARLFLTIYLHNIPSLICRNVEKPSYVATFRLRVANGTFSEYPRHFIFHKLPVIRNQHTTHQWLIQQLTLRSLPRVDYPSPQGRIPCVGNTVPTKLSLIREQNVRQNLK